MLVVSAATVFAETDVSYNNSESVDFNNPVAQVDEDKATPSVGQLIRFIPVTIDVTRNEVKVRGYFVNMNESKAVGSFEKVKMNVYRDGKFLVGGNFGTIHDFIIDPLSLDYEGFSFGGSHDLNTGSFACGDSYYCVLECSFSTYR